MYKRPVIGLEAGDRTPYIIGLLCLFIYAGTLFFPLMDKDAAHHANIALHMLQYDDYVSLIDRNTDYLDKPHFLFWSSALSFKIFGVNTFAHRLPAVLFALISVISVFKLTRHLSNLVTARLAALLLATAQGFIISISDARMETPLTAAIVFGLWQLIVYIDNRKIGNLVLAALGVAIAFSTKGWIGPAITFMAVFFYVLFQKKWKVLLSPRTWLFIPFFAVFISPVLYAYYLQYDLHPEKVIRNMTNISGVKFILWDQNFERFSGDSFNKGGRNSSVFFLYHTFLWAFFPWSLVAYIALIYWLRRMFAKRKWNHPFNFAAAAFGLILFTISFSKFKMPHYIFMLMPLAAIFTAPWLRMALSSKGWLKFLYPLHFFFAILVVIATVALNFYFFQPTSIFVLTVGILLLAGLFYLLFKPQQTRAKKTVLITAGFMIVFNFFLFYNFYPGLFKYQGGNELAWQMERDGVKVEDKEIVLLDHHAHTFDFYRGYNHTTAEVADIESGKIKTDSSFFLMTTGIANDLRSKGYNIVPIASHVDFNVSTLKLKFLNPATRASKLDTLMLTRIYR